MIAGRLNIIILLLVSLFFSTSTWDDSAMLMAQPEKSGVKKEVASNEAKAADGNTAIREEIQRYIGYEPLFYRYVTLPYDLTMNSNVQGPFIEIGFLLLIFLPILLLIGFKNKKYLSIGTMVMVFLIGLISFANNPLKPGVKSSNNKEITTYLNDNSTAKKSSVLESAVGNLYMGAKKIPGINSLAANKDYFSYFVLIGLFSLLFLLINERVKTKNLTKRIITLYLLFYAFMFLIMTAGIVWYGYLFFAVATLFLFKEIYNYRKADSIVKKYVFYLCGATSMIWVMMAFTFRMTNHNKSNLNKNNAHLMYEPAMINYQAGKNTQADLKEVFFKNSENAFKDINSDLNAKVIKIGTPFNFFIEKSDSRVLEDNQLNNMSRLIKEMPNKLALAGALKDAGYKYIIVDLNTHTLDRTPEKTLLKKFRNLLKFVFQNPRAELIATDRLLKQKLPDDPSKMKIDYGVFGDIHYAGTYAIYRFK